MVTIPQTLVYAAYNEVGKCCLHCEKCSEACLVKRARGYLLSFTKNGRQISEGSINEQFSQFEIKPYDRNQLLYGLAAVEKCCQHCGENHLEACFVNNSRKALERAISVYR